MNLKGPTSNIHQQNNILTSQAFAVKLKAGSLDTVPPVVAASLLGRVADGYVQFAVLAAEARHARAYVTVVHVNASAVVETRVGLAFVVVGFAIVT